MIGSYSFSCVYNSQCHGRYDQFRVSITLDKIYNKEEGEKI